jgi:hypothetical protein
LLGVGNHVGYIVITMDFAYRIFVLTIDN